MTKINSKQHITKKGVVKKNPESSLSRKLAHFTGTEAYTRGWMGVLMTDGVVFLGSEGNASWLVTDISTIVKVHQKVKDEDFVAIKVESKNKKAVVRYEDGNNNLLYQQRYEYTDLEEGKYTLYYMNGVLLLSSEY